MWRWRAGLGGGRRDCDVGRTEQISEREIVVNIASLAKAASDMMRLLDDYTNPPKRERELDLVLYGFLEGRFGKMSRQHHVKMYGSERPHRIDFRRSAGKSVVIEFAVRPPTGGAHLHGPQNHKELRKLTRVERAGLRALLLLDLAEGPIMSREQLQQSYDQITAGPGRGIRKSVRIIYVHRFGGFHFLWRPKRRVA